jgi:hypothetical protein
MQQNQRSRPTPKGRAINNTSKKLDVSKVKSWFPPVDLVNEETGEVYQIYQYKARFHFLEQFAKDKSNPFYNYPDYLIVMEYHRRHGKTFPQARFLDMIRDLVLQREWKCKEVFIYDNTGIVTGNIMYHSMNVEGEELKVLVNYLFPNRPGYIIHPKSLKK